MPDLNRFCPGAPIILVGLNHSDYSPLRVEDDESEPKRPEKPKRPEESELNNKVFPFGFSHLSTTNTGSRTKYEEQGGIEQQQQQQEEDPFVPFLIRREIGAPKYFFCDPVTAFGVDELFEYVRYACPNLILCNIERLRVGMLMFGYYWCRRLGLLLNSAMDRKRSHEMGLWVEYGVL
jgi:hypothetical protein